MRVPTILAFLFVLAVSVGVRAQDNPPPPADDFVPERWKEFVSTDGSFKVSMPGVPKEVSQPIDNKPGSAVVHFYALTTVTAKYSAGYTTFGRDLERLQSSKITLDGIRNRTLAKESGKLLSEEDFGVNTDTLYKRFPTRKRRSRNVPSETSMTIARPG